MIRSAGESATAATGAAAVEIGLTMSVRRQYRLTARTNGVWFRVVVGGASGAAAAGAGSHFLPVNTSVEVACIGRERTDDGADNPALRNRISVIQDGGAGSATLSEVPTVGSF